MLADELQQPLATGMEVTYVIYPVGGYYQPHIDAMDGTSSAKRCVSFICYLTPSGWTYDDGGALRVHYGRETDSGSGAQVTRDADTGADYEDVAPESGSLVLFDSKQLWHEVLPTRRERACLVGWFHSV